MAYSKVYKNIAFDEPWSSPETLYHGGFFNLALLNDDATAPVFDIYIYSKNNMPVYPVQLEYFVNDALNRPIYRLYDGLVYKLFNIKSPLRCWAFFNIWVRPDGTTFKDDTGADHSTEGCERLNYINSDWIFWDTATSCLKARMYITETGEVIEDFIRSDWYGTNAAILYNLGAITSDATPDGKDHACLLLPYSEIDSTYNHCGLRPFEIDKKKYNYDSSIIDYMEEFETNEQHTIMYDDNAQSYNILNPIKENINQNTRYSGYSFAIHSPYIDKFKFNGLYYAKLIENKKQYTSNKTLDEIIEEKRASQYWQTPDEFYSKTAENRLYCATDGTGYYKFGDNKDTRPNWFWVNSLKTWCTFKYTNFDEIILCAWNGRNGWDPFDTILKYNNPDDCYTLANDYMYNISDLIEGPSFDVMPLSNKKNAYKHTKCRSFLGFTTGHTTQENNEPNRPFVKKTLRLNADTNFSYHDSNTYQTIKPSTIYLDDVMKRYVFPIGCPMIERMPNGELCIVYHLELFGVRDKPLITRDMIKFMNSICITFFGDGNDKTIEDWKTFRSVDHSQEYPSGIADMDSDSLFEKPEINTSVVKNEFASLSFTIPTEYPSTENAVNDDFAERWER